MWTCIPCGTANSDENGFCATCEEKRPIMPSTQNTYHSAQKSSSIQSCILSTTPMLEGYKIIRYDKLVYSNENYYDKAGYVIVQQQAFAKLNSLVLSMNCNAVLSLQIAAITTGSDNGVLTVYGTAALVEKIKQ